ncbi:MAG: aminotransferase class IV [Bacteroidales bacterium]|nr:aminotransferase class IV [Bacteroidales bacterium]
MDKSDIYININGELSKADERTWLATHRGFHYGDGLFESMHAFATQVQLFDFHYKRLIAGMRVLKINHDDKLKKNNLALEIERLLKRNRLFTGARVRLTIFRNADGLYTPKGHQAAYIIEASPLPYKFYKLNERGLTIGIFPEMRKAVNYLSPFKTCNALLSVMAGIYAADNHWDDCLIINENNFIVEGYHSNVFLYRDETLFTPGVESGCVMGVMRETIIHLAHQVGIKTVEVEGFQEEDLLAAEEIFLTNAVEGLRWVLAFKNRRYFHKISALLNDQLNTSLFSQHL